MSSPPGCVARLGLALTSPRWALALAADRRHAGRSGTDLMILLGLVLVATQLRGLFGAVWVGTAISPGLGVRAVVDVLTRALTVELGFLVVAAVVLWLAAGAKRNLGRAFDLACVAALPLLFVDLGATVVVRALDLSVPGFVSIALASASFAWAGILVALAYRPAKIATSITPPIPAETTRRGRRAGVAILAVAAIGAVVQALWIGRTMETLRPMTPGHPAPAFALPAIGPAGALDAPVSLASLAGKVVVLDFWATWCSPCLKAMPKLDALAARHPDVVVIAINLDDPAEARALWDARAYRILLLADDGQVSGRYGVRDIPHSVVIDRTGVVRLVARGAGADVEGAVTRILAEPIRN